jgi:hypothetical protein
MLLAAYSRFRVLGSKVQRLDNRKPMPEVR